MARTTTTDTAVVRPYSPYASFMLTLIMLILLAILIIMIYGAAHARSVSNNYANKIDNLNTRLQNIENGLHNFTGH